MLHYSGMIFCHILSSYGIQFVRVPLPKICCTSLKLKLRTCMNASISKFRLLTTTKKKIKMLTIYPLAMFAYGFCCHVFEVLIRTFRKRTYAYLILLNF